VEVSGQTTPPTIPVNSRCVIHSDGTNVRVAERKRRFRAYNNSGQVIASPGALVEFDAETFDPDSIFNTSSYLVAPERGTWRFHAAVYVSGTWAALENAQLWIYNATSAAAVAVKHLHAPSASANTHAEVDTTVFVNGTDAYGVFLVNGGALKAISAGTTQTYFEGYRVA
jgi:hypothetical protein